MSQVKRMLFLFTGISMLSCQDIPQGVSKEELTDYPTMLIIEEQTTVYEDYPVVLEGKKEVEIRPKIEGFIASILVDEGQEVKKGQVLFRLYAPQYQEENTSARANLTRAEAELKEAKMKVAKAQPLVEQNIISAYELESTQYNLKSKEAQLVEAQANLSNTKANVGYTQIVAPFDGVIGLIPYKEGALVHSNALEPLTIISDISDIHTYLAMNEKKFFDFMKQEANITIKERLAQVPEVGLILANGQEYSKKGRINTVSGQLDPLTGSINFRAVFDNDAGMLRSGNSARVRVYEQLDHAILIPQKSTYDLQGKRFVYVVGKEGIVKSKEIQISDQEPSSQSYIVTKGLQKGDRIVSGDIANLKDGVQIKL
ncbi:membrane fusion protein (multidrug efflux system) [Myroides gitamensis]|uniref:efflux RND transporter periplasmic adaptor subunit n=1 Tax=Myroides odoratus TaxID=256 RepID=UPI002167FD5B|nr:efflux RND transporter periplasmic adaptor subunit [Myroides odoratus]MCS4239815.1 membrane fusion protein (multidrug efflux system) [Myroides odoratus]MDH6600653.1 membrane fusion protein (multidrug efflux system) [Myroides gitamensis]